MSGLAKFQATLSQMICSAGIYRAEKEIDKALYLIWREERGFRIERWNKPDFSCDYIRVLNFEDIALYIPPSLLLSDDWLFHAYFPW